MIKEENKDLAYWKANAEEDYMQVPISVLRYISELEEVVKNCFIPNVVNRRELLVDFAMKRNNAPDFVREQYERDADEYLSKIN